MRVKNLCEAESFTCPGDVPGNYECLDCNNEVQNCLCIKEDPDTIGLLYCNNCNDTRDFDVFDTNVDPSMELLDEDPNSYEHYLDIDSDDEDLSLVRHKQKEEYYGTLFTKCRHRNFPVEFPDGTIVYASSQHKRNHDEPAPDLGVYLDWSWQPMGVAYYIDWRDYGLPTTWVGAGKTIIDAFEKAREGLWVEVGCIGGHGRTGTALAAMAVLAGVPADEAVEWVQENYCKEAVETAQQEWWVEWFAGWLVGTDVPDFPQSKLVNNKSVTEMVEFGSYKEVGPIGFEDDNFSALWVDAHGWEDVDTSDKIVQQFRTQSTPEQDISIMDDSDWDEIMFEAADGETVFPIHFLSAAGEALLLKTLEGVSLECHQFLAMYYYMSDEHGGINGISDIRDGIAAYEAAYGDDDDMKQLTLEIPSVYHYCGSALPFDFRYNNEDEIVELHEVMVSLSLDAEAWVIEHMATDFSTLTEIKSLVKRYDNLTLESF